jgi:hypothetical protein
LQPGEIPAAAIDLEAIIFATLLGPVLAVQAQKWLERRRALREIRRIIAAWKDYLSHLGNRAMPVDQWPHKRLDLMIDLLHSMADYLDYDFAHAQIREEVYWPEGAGKLEEQFTALRQAALEVLTGKTALAMDVRSIPAKQPPEGHDAIA